MSEPRHRYSAVSLTLHWLIAALIVVQILLINAHEAADQDRLFIGLHKAVGLSILVLTLLRLGWRVGNPALPFPTEMPRWERWLARGVQTLFYVALIVIPMTGWLASSASGREISFFGLFNWPLLPVGGGRDAARGFMEAHGLAVKGLYVLIVLHVAGALKHHFINRDNVLHRMIPFIPRRP